MHAASTRVTGSAPLRILHVEAERLENLLGLPLKAALLLLLVDTHFEVFT